MTKSIVTALFLWLSPAIETERISYQITGDEVLSVNGTAFQGLTHQEALDIFKVILHAIF